MVMTQVVVLFGEILVVDITANCNCDFCVGTGSVLYSSYALQDEALDVVVVVVIVVVVVGSSSSSCGDA